MTGTAQEDLARVVRAESGRILAALIAQCGDMDLAEDALQEAYIQAAEKWHGMPLPKNPSAWIFTVAKRRLTDHYRKLKIREREENALAIYASLHDSIDHREDGFDIPEERLRLIFTCCHPALSEEARVALTLKSMCGLTVKEIARAFLTSESTMEQRLTRAKRKIKQAGIKYKIPDKSHIPERLPSVLSVIYLIYNESYSAYEGQTLTRADLANEAIRLARILYLLLPHSNVGGLLALILFHDARRLARFNCEQGFISLENQERSLWNRSLIEEGESVLKLAIEMGPTDSYKIQAAISALHCQAESWVKTDWKQIVCLYFTLYKLEPSPIVYLNYSIALANSGKVEDAYPMILSLENSLKNYQPFYAAKASLEEKLKKYEYAKKSYISAIELSENQIEMEYLESKLKQLNCF